MPHSPLTQIYYWPRSFILRSCRFEQQQHYQRAAMTLIVAAQGEFQIATQGLGPLSCAGMLLGPASRRQGLSIASEDQAAATWMFDVAPGTREHRGLLEVLRRRPEAPLPDALVERMRSHLAAVAEQAVLEPSQAVQLHTRVFEDLLDGRELRELDDRVTQVLACLRERCLDEIAIGDLAAGVGLSESRLRSLVRRELGTNLVQVSRWSAAWQTMLHWRPGMTLTDAAHAAGFHDLPHANRTAKQMFGLSPSRALDATRVLLVPCSQA